MKRAKKRGYLPGPWVLVRRVWIYGVEQIDRVTYTRPLSSADLESLRDNPWQIFKQEQGR